MDKQIIIESACIVGILFDKLQETYLLKIKTNYVGYNINSSSKILKLNEDSNIIIRDYQEYLDSNSIQILKDFRYNDCQQKCPDCNSSAYPVNRLERELYPDAMYDGASTLYNICPDCKYVYSYIH